MKLSIQHRLTVGLAVDLANVADATEYAKEDKDVAKEAALAMRKEAQEFVASDKELMTKVPNGIEKAGPETIKADFNAVEIHLVAVRQSIEKGDDLGGEIQAKSLKDKGLAVSGEIHMTVDTAGGEKRTTRGYVQIRPS